MPRFVMYDNAVAMASMTSTGTANGSYSFGAAAVDRIMVAGISYIAGGGNSITGVTIGGVASTLIAKVNFTAGDTAEIWAAAVPSGASGTVTASVTGVTAIGFTMYSLTGASGVTASSTATSAGITISLSIPANGAAIGVANNVAAGASSLTWQGLTEDSDFATSGNSEASAASGNFSAAQSLTVTATPNSALAFGLAGAAWGPA